MDSFTFIVKVTEAEVIITGDEVIITGVEVIITGAELVIIVAEVIITGALLVIIGPEHLITELELFLTASDQYYDLKSPISFPATPMLIPGPELAIPLKLTKLKSNVNYFFHLMRKLKLVRFFDFFLF